MWIHTVVAGDTLRNIAARYGSSTRELNLWNELDQENVLVPGLHLLVPGAPTGVQRYQVRAGDSLDSIARRLGVPVDHLQRWTGFTSATVLTTGQTLWLPKSLAAGGERQIEANGYLLPAGTESDANVLRDVRNLTYVCVFSYQVRADGSLHPAPDAQVLSAVQTLAIAPLVTVTNFDGSNFNSDLAHTVLANGSLRRRIIDNILQVLKSKRYRGVNVDFEHMYPGDRALYNRFLGDLGAAVHAQGYSVSIAMGPKTSNDPQAAWMGAFDYQTLGQEVDFLMLMTYEWGWVGGPPMAVAPANQVRAVLDYAKSVIDPAKIMMGIALYGYDWPLPYVQGKTRASSLSSNSAQNLAIAQEVPIQWDALSASPFYRYRDAAGTDRIVWFEDALSALVKFQMVLDLGLRGVSYWVLGNSFPQVWQLMSGTFTVKKV